MNELTVGQSRESLQSEIVELKRQLAEAHAVILKLSRQIEELQRAGKRQAVPFARREHVKKPRKRGRKLGQGQVQESRKAKSGRDQRDQEGGVERLSTMPVRVGGCQGT